MAFPADSYATTFGALTASYVPKVLVDNIFVGTPVLNKLRQHTLPLKGKNWEPIIEYESATGEWYDKGDITTLGTSVSGDIATRAQFVLQFYRKPVLLNAQDTDLQDGAAIIDLMKAYVKNATKKMANDISHKAFYGNPAGDPKTINSLWAACDDVDIPQAFGGIAVAEMGVWKAHTMEGQTTHTVPVSPSLENISKMIRSIIGSTGERPDLVAVEDAYWDALSSQITRNEYLMALQANAGNEVVKWGFTTLFVNNVPIVADRDCPGWAVSDLTDGGAWGAGNDYVIGEEVKEGGNNYVCIQAHYSVAAENQPAEATAANIWEQYWLLQDNGASANRMLMGGYQAFFLNFDHLKLAYNSKRSWKWDPAGWRRPTDYDQYLNYIYAWLTIGTDSRRTNGHIFNVDLTQTPADWTPGVVSLPG